MCGILLQPILPGVAARLLDALRVGEGEDERGLDAAQVGKGREQPGAMRRVVLVPKEVVVDSEGGDANVNVKGGGVDGGRRGRG